MNRIKLLIYNWDPIDGPAGGGVTAYIKELIPLLLGQGIYKIWFLSCGRKYDSGQFVRVQKTDNIFGNDVRSYEIVNSPILSPGNQSIKNVSLYLSDTLLSEAIARFIEEEKGFDIIHFHNLEGLSLRTLQLKEYYPKIKFIYTFHNYYPICTQVNLWKDGKKNCDTTDYIECMTCYQKENYDLAQFRFRHLRIPGLKQIFQEYSKEYPDIGDSDVYIQFRKKNIEFFNKYMDLLLAVSNKTRQILVSSGILPEKIVTCYAGNEFVKGQIDGRPHYVKSGTLNIIYIGYMRRDKGFYFFMECMEKMPVTLAEKIKITVVARHKEEDLQELKELKRLKSKFEDVRLLNGYADHEDLKNILSGQHLGIVPVLWEDNLPRVAMEQTAMGVPILSSDLGGTPELSGKNPDFIFRAGNVEDFLDKLARIEADREMLADYWKGAMKLPTMEEHAENLTRLYLKIMDRNNQK